MMTLLRARAHARLKGFKARTRRSSLTKRMQATDELSIGRTPLLRIRPSSGWAALNLREVLQFRDLLVALAARDVKLRYKQTALGIAWVIFQPLLAAGIFTLVFGL